MGSARLNAKIIIGTILPNDAARFSLPQREDNSRCRRTGNESSGVAIRELDALKDSSIHSNPSIAWCAQILSICLFIVILQQSSHFRACY